MASGCSRAFGNEIRQSIITRRVNIMPASWELGAELLELLQSISGKQAWRPDQSSVHQVCKTSERLEGSTFD